ncbi:MAG TPA: ABC transporter ATP-binding protein [Kiritimatiellia bacterium]|nr:ABC transporter ATP-binding protein [Kiritimatiellia bacterium]
MNKHAAIEGSGTVLVEARDVGKAFTMGQTRIDVLRGVSLGVYERETLAITGASGAGKSTLLHALGGLERPSGGQILWRGEDLYAMSGSRRNELRSQHIGFVFQSFHLLPELDVLDNVLLPVWSRRGTLRQAREHRERALGLLASVGLAERARHRPLELSGGEQQRVAIARALINEPEIVFADEPTGNLDSRTGETVLSYLFDLTGGNRHTLVLVTHNEALADSCGRRLDLRDGSLSVSNVE